MFPVSTSPSYDCDTCGLTLPTKVKSDSCKHGTPSGYCWRKDCPGYVGTAEPEQQSSWEDEFDKEFGRVHHHDESTQSMQNISRRRIKDFVRVLLAQAKEEERKRIVEVLQGMVVTCTDCSSNGTRIICDLEESNAVLKRILAAIAPETIEKK